MTATRDAAVAAFQRWQLEFDEVNRSLTQIEDAERATLRAVHCPTDPVAIYAILAGERPAPWPARTAIRQRQRARRAMQVLALIPAVRRHLQFGSENSCAAAAKALLVGLLVNDPAALLRETASRGGRRRAVQRRQITAAQQTRVAQLAAEWRGRVDLQVRHRTAAAYVRTQMPILSLRVIQKYLQRRRRRRSA